MPNPFAPLVARAALRFPDSDPGAIRTRTAADRLALTLYGHGLRGLAATQRGAVDALAAQGVQRFLIGESLMRQDDIAAATRALVG